MTSKTSSYRLSPMGTEKPLPSLPLHPTSAHPEGLESLHQAANYASLSHEPLPEPRDLSSAIIQLGRDMERWNLPSRPSMLPRGESSSTVSGKRIAGHELRVSTSSNGATPAARRTSNPFEKLTVAEKLEQDVVSPSLTSSDSPFVSESSSEDSSRRPGKHNMPSPHSAQAVGLYDGLGSKPTYRLSTQSPSSDAVGRVASPDSWRSLLPEDDPYFASDATLADARNNQRTGSLSLDDERPDFNRTGSQESSAATSQTDGSRRYSSASSYASIESMLSVPRPIPTPQDGNHEWPVDSWRSLLPLNGSSSPATSVSPAMASISPPPSPPVKHRLDTGGFAAGHALMRATGNMPGRGDSRRPASFSTIDAVGQRRVPSRWAGAAGSTTSEAGSPSSALSRAKETTASPSKDSIISSSLQNPSPPSRRYARTAMEDGDEREMWPCSRNGRDQFFDLLHGEDVSNTRRHSAQPDLSIEEATTTSH